jgi:predicted acylesterase/phospholipase RssA
MISAVANRAKQGRLLLVATTDLDKEESVIWNMGAIAEHGGTAARQLFCKVLVASASIPGVFPPVLIPVEGEGKSYDEMHVDGSTTLPLFIASEIMEEMPLSLVELHGAEVYVIVNGQLNAAAKTTPGRPAAVLSRSFSAALMSASRRALVVTADFAHSYHMHFRFTYLPMNYPSRGPLAFKFSNMDDLFQYGAHCANTNRLWTTFRNAITERQLAGAQIETTSDACPGTESVTIQ